MKITLHTDLDIAVDPTWVGDEMRWAATARMDGVHLASTGFLGTYAEAARELAKELREKGLNITVHLRH